MNLLNSRLNRRTLGGVTLGAAATTSLAYLVSAQDATPEAEVEEAAQPTLAELETVTQVDVVANNNSYALYVAGMNPPGWYSFNVQNASEADASFNLVKLPEGLAIGDFTSFLHQMNTGTLTALPEWLLGATFAGGTYVPVGGTNSVLMNLDAGEWIAFSDLATSTQSVTKVTVQSEEALLEEGETPAATPEGGEAAAVVPPDGFGSTFTVSVGDGAITADGSPAAGYNVIGVRNDSSMPASFVLVHSAEPVDEAGAADLISAWYAGEETGAHVVGGMGVISVDSYGYVELTAEAGTYVGFSGVINMGGGRQFEDGAVTIFTVA